ncbi:MAG: DUF4293 domain-containing protein [Flavobacteriales bacterium]|nr:DUF4293 domain-containing protein [Flavobacteriales bacterium]MCW8913724.1 DUF4293 domain-containing protein [Flavobacteriales bacterium]MCW8937896.1 DUF4293 domain-containing protein [Flavobacteriales bacterium]MCW8940618.1 DUF4293 domain-containing protein [Flavobacteriales bacterium]MCW8967328.1 DUF4293 domain-containing protein [Flavobacteriales bacterium]
MIQRIQSLFLLVIALSGVIFLFTPILEIINYESFYTMDAFNVFEMENNAKKPLKSNIGLAVMSIIITLLASTIIFLYKNRPLQIKLAKFLILLLALELAALFFYSDAATTFLSNPLKDQTTISYKIGVVIPIISIIFAYLSIRFIKKDDELVRSADRLR